MLENFRNVLVVSPHSDDAEFGAGGTIAQLVALGAEVTHIVFSACEESVPDGFPRDILRIEAKAASSALGIKPSSLAVLNYEVRRFNYSRQEILDHLVEVSKQLAPDLVLQPNTSDMHQDHSVVANESLRAFSKNTTILGYELPWNHAGGAFNCFVPLHEKYISAKIVAIEQYKSQNFRKYANPEVIRAWARTRGLNTSCDYAEAFEVIRWHLR